MTTTKHPIVDEYTIKYVGANLFNELSKSLYEPEHVIREYLQNAVDSHKQWRDIEGELPEESINIEIRSNSVSIIDFGVGMGEEEMKNVKAIAISKKGKQGSNLTGQKGVGIWSGLSFFDKIVITSTKRGEAKRYTLTIEFGQIRKKLNSPEADSMSVGDVMNGNYLLDWEVFDEDEHGTTVTLNEPKEQITSFLDPDNIMSAVRRFAPCRIDSDFKFKDELERWYKDNNVITLPIAVCGEEVFKSYSNDVVGFSNTVVSVNSIPVVRAWMALSSSNNLIKDDLTKIPSGFALVQNGFTLDRNYGTEAVAKLPQINNPYLSWYIGEMHVNNEYVLPNLNRKGLQLDSNTLLLIQNLREWYEALDAETRQISYVRNHLDNYRELHKIVDKIIDLIDKDVQDGSDEKLIAKFMSDYDKEQKKLSKLPDAKRRPDFAMFSYKSSLHSEMLKVKSALSPKWKEVRENRLGTPTLSQISKSNPGGKQTNTKSPPVPLPQQGTEQSPLHPTTLSNGNNHTSTSEPARKITLTVAIAANILRETFESMEPVASVQVLEKIIKEYSRNLKKVVGDA